MEYSGNFSSALKLQKKIKHSNIIDTGIVKDSKQTNFEINCVEIATQWLQAVPLANTYIGIYSGVNVMSTVEANNRCTKGRVGRQDWCTKPIHITYTGSV